VTSPNPNSLTFQELILRLQTFWAERGCVLQQPYDVEVGAGTMAPETFLRVLGPQPYKVAYIQPSRRPADGRYGENPNRLYKHTQLQVILKPPPENVQELYLQSLSAIGIDLRQHDIKFEEDNWEAPTLSAWGVGWQVMLDGLEITQFTYFQQCGGLDLDPISAELTYGLERIAAFLQDKDSVYDIVWARDPETGRVTTYGDVRLAEEVQFSKYNFEAADIESAWEHFELYESECKALIEPSSFDWESGDRWIRWSWDEFLMPLNGQRVRIPAGKTAMNEIFHDGEPDTRYEFVASVDRRDRSVSFELAKSFKESGNKIVLATNLRAQTQAEGAADAGFARFSNPFALPLPAYDLCLKCSHLFNILDARGAISVTERVGVIARVRALAVGIARAYVDQQQRESAGSAEESEKKLKSKKKLQVAPIAR
jgi:glycyl-tRNA synthetase alpha chain